MNGDPGPLRDDNAADSSSEADVEVALVLERYLSDLEAGRPADPESLIAAHPHLAGPLRACLEVMCLPFGVPGESGSRGTVHDTMPRNRQSSGGSTSPWRTDDGLPHVHLPEPAGQELAPMLTRPGLPVCAGRFHVLGEIARGGMGVVLRARDADLGRELAVKALLRHHRDDPDFLHRFVEEAQIGGQLQHPGIVHVYELGAFPDGRPFLAMKLVHGKTLAALLADRPSPADDLPQFLSIFEAICQTVAYAHSRRVIHRDLKPSNVMVGSFGEVQVMDWGLAKVLPEGGVADEAKRADGEPAVTRVQTARTGGSGSDSQAGSVRGTPAYLAPEQARGEIDRINERADVFGLGAILCEILTGRPPYEGSTRGEVQARAAQGDLAGALTRLGTCGADEELSRLAGDCLAARPSDRPRDAGAVARRITAHTTGVQERLRLADLARVEAQTRAAEERKRRRVTVALAASVLVSAGIFGGGWAYLSRERQRHAAYVDMALREAEVLRDEAIRAADDPARWLAARDAAHVAGRMLADARDVGTQERVRVLVHQVTEGTTAAENDQKLLANLVDIRSARADDPDGSEIDAAYADAFREAGIDLDALSAAEAGARIKTRPLPVSLALAGALDSWASVRRAARPKPVEAWERLVVTARAVDPDPHRDHVRELWTPPELRAQRDSLRTVAQEADPETWPAESLNLLAGALVDSGDPEDAETLLRRAQAVHPGDIWVNHNLGAVLEKLSRRDEAIRFYTAARAIRPETAHELAHALAARVQGVEAIALFRDLRRLRPGNPRHLTCLGQALAANGMSREAAEALEAAVAVSRELIRLKPDFSEAHRSLGHALGVQGKYDEAIAEFRMVMRLKPGNAEAHYNLGMTLTHQGKHDEAIAEFRTAIHSKPEYATAHAYLGNALRAQGRFDEAITECRTAVRLRPDDADSHNSLGLALTDTGKHEEAIAELRTAISLKPDNADAHTNLGRALFAQGKRDEAVAEVRAALLLNPNLAEAHYGLGFILANQGKLNDAIVEYRTAIRIKPDYAEAYCNLGQRLRAKGEYAEAVQMLQKGHDLGSRRPGWRYPSAAWVVEAERMLSLSQRFPAILRGNDKPRDNPQRLAFAQMAYDRKYFAAAARLWAEALESEPKIGDDRQAQPRYNAACAAALGAAGQGKDDPPLDEAAKGHWRRQAIDWLKADLAFWTRQVESGPPQVRQFVAQTLQHWKVDPDLAGLRDPNGLAKLPAPEQKDCQALWFEVDAILGQAHEGRASIPGLRSAELPADPFAR